MFTFLGPDTDFYLLWIGFYVVIMLYATLKYIRNRGKIRVRIMTAEGQKIEFFKPEKDGRTIIVEKNQGRRLGWTFTFERSSLYFYPRSLLSFIPLPRGIGLDVVYDSPQAITYNFQANAAEIYPLTKGMIKEITEAQVIKNMGKGDKPEKNTFALIALVVSGASLVILILIAQRFGIF